MLCIRNVYGNGSSYHHVLRCTQLSPRQSTAPWSPGTSSLSARLTPSTIQGDGKAALKGVYRASLRLSRPGALRFSSGLFLHLATDACFTILEQVCDE